MFSYENISQNKEMFKSTTGLEADYEAFQNLQLDLKLMIFRLFLNFSTPVLIARISNFMMVKIRENLKVILKMLNLEKRQSS